jgi:MYND finger
MTSSIHTISSKVCSSCAQPETTNSGKLKTCGKCHSVYYCSPACQKKSWPAHKEKCKEYAKIYQKLQQNKDDFTEETINLIQKEIRMNMSYRNAHNLPPSQIPIADGIFNATIRFLDCKNDQRVTFKAGN